VAIGGVFLVMGASGLAHLLLGVSLLDHLHLLPSCPVRAATGMPCPGCGITRGLLLLAELRFAEALAVNPAAPFLAGAMAWQGFGPRVRVIRWPDALSGVLLVAVIGGWMARALAV
jgi:hypothetical protein